MVRVQPSRRSVLLVCFLPATESWEVCVFLVAAAVRGGRFPEGSPPAGARAPLLGQDIQEVALV